MYIEMIKRKVGKTFFVSTFLDCYRFGTKIWKSVKIGGEKYWKTHKIRV